MRVITLALLCSSLLCPLSSFAQGACERLVATGRSDHPPYLWRDPVQPDRLMGANADLLARIGKDIGVTIEVVDSGSWSEAQAAVEAGRVDLLAGVFLNLPRLEQMDFIHPAFFYSQTVVWVRESETFTYASWADLKGRKGAVMAGTSRGWAFDDYAEKELQLDTVPSVEAGFSRLMSGELDYLLYERYPAIAWIHEHELDEQVRALDIPLSSDAVFLGLSHNSACNDAWLRGQLAKSMTELVAAGVPEQILQQNFERWQKQQDKK